MVVENGDIKDVNCYYLSLSLFYEALLLLWRPHGNV